MHMLGGLRMIEKNICRKYPDGSPEIHAPQMFCPFRGKVSPRNDWTELYGRAKGPKGWDPWALEEARPKRFWRQEAALLSCSGLASGALRHTGCIWAPKWRGRRRFLRFRSKPLTTRGHDGGNRGTTKRFPGARRFSGPKT